MFDTFSVDLGKAGLEMLFEPWQIEAMQTLWRGGAWKSAEVHDALKTRGVDISRASVINFLNRMAGDDVLNYVDKPGRGGYCRVYSAALSEAQLWDEITSKIIDKIKEASS